ncbi:MAG: hypothetical protein AAFX02_00675 [Pseudomonadota bacterium]
MPKPNEITEAWLIKYDWIIRDALLDQSYRQSLQYLSQTFAGDEFSVDILEQQWQAQPKVVQDLRQQGAVHQTLRDAARQAVDTAVTMVAATEASESLMPPSIGFNLGKQLFSAGGDIAESELENARSALEWAEQDLDRLEGSIREAMTALERATEALVAAIRARLNLRTQIDRLILHVKENILHYMQAIWMEEHPDQRYLRLYDMEIQWPGALSGTFSKATKPNVVELADLAAFNRFRNNRPTVPAGAIKFDTPSFTQTRRLHQVANLDKPLGFRGNFALFELTEPNQISLFMAQEYMDTYFGINDPEPFSDLPTASEALEIARCVWRNPKLDESGRKDVAAWLIKTLNAAHRVSEEVVVPTGELFIEALPGSHPLLEDFKLRHRAYDAEMAATNVRLSQLEMVRRAMRLEDGDLTDPDIDKTVRVTAPVQPSVDIDDV